MSINIGMALIFNTPRYGNVFVVSDTFADLRSVSITQIIDGYIAISSGKLFKADGLGDLFVWDDDSILADDDATVLQPTSAAIGRWIKIGRGASGSQPIVNNANVLAALGFTPASSTALATLSTTVAGQATTLSTVQSAVAALQHPGRGFLPIDSGYSQMLADLDYNFFDPTYTNAGSNPRIRPTENSGANGTQGHVNNSYTTAGSYWQMTTMLKVWFAHWRATGSQAHRGKIGLEWGYLKSIFTATQLGSNGTSDGTIPSNVQQAALKAQSLSMFYKATGDVIALTALASMIPAVLTRFADPTAGMTVSNSGFDYSRYGLIYASGIQSSTLSEIGLCLSALDVAEGLGYVNAAVYAKAMFATFQAKLKKSNGIYYSALDLAPASVDSGGASHYLKPVNDYFGAPQQGVSATGIGHNLGLAVLAARLYRRYGDAAYLAEAVSIASAIAAVHIQSNGFLLNDYDAWTDGFYAAEFVAEVLNLPGVDTAGTLRAAFKATAAQIVSVSTGGFYSPEWSANATVNATGFTTWAQMAATANGNPSTMATPQQIMTSASSGSMIQAGWLAQ